jgi:asparagine synthase (glutamine-hydrolysing)
MIKYLLSEYKSYPWKKYKNIFFRGEFHYKDTLVNVKSNEDILEKIYSDLNHNFDDTLKKFNGNFGLIIEKKNSVLLASDRILSFPILYAFDKKNVLVSDDIHIIKQELNIKQTEFHRAKEFLAAGFITGNRTLYKEINIVQAGEYVNIGLEDCTIQLNDYYMHRHVESMKKNAEQLKQEYEDILESVFLRTIERLNNRCVVLFLSGGYDSRLVAIMLNKLGYTNVLCVSFGNPNSKEVVVAKSIAESLNYEWLLIENPQNELKEFINSPDYYDFLVKASGGFCIPYLQGLFLKKLVDDHKISSDSVVLTGNSGDVIEGDQFNNSFKEGMIYTKNDIIDAILEKHHIIFGKKLSISNEFRTRISEVLPNRDEYSYEDVQDLLELYNWRERQAKYVVNDVRCYDLCLGLEWQLPLWDNELVDFWLRVPANLRKNRKFYYYCIDDENYPTANEVTNFKKTTDQMKKKAMWMVEFLYPIRKLYLYISNKNHLPYYVGLRDYINILRITKGYRTETTTCNIYNYIQNACTLEFLTIEDYYKN